MCNSKIQCPICNKMIRRNYRVAHMKRHNNERNFACMLCDRAFVMAGDLTTHLKVHSSPTPSKIPSSKKFAQPQTCGVCGQKFIGISAYERHIQSHGTSASLYECDICGRTVKEKKNLLSHMLFRHSDMPKLKAPCPICGKVFNRKYLKLHVRKHNVLNQKPSHICPVCGKSMYSGGRNGHAIKIYLPFHYSISSQRRSFSPYSTAQPNDRIVTVQHMRKDLCICSIPCRS